MNRLLLLLMLISTLVGCSRLELENLLQGEPSDKEEEVSGGNQETGEPDDPRGDPEELDAITVKEAQELPLGTEVTVVGYYRGYVSGSSMSGAIFDSYSGTPNTNLLLGCYRYSYDVEECMPVALPAKSPIREALNLHDHPELFGKRLLIRGMLDTYFKVTGIRNPQYWAVLTDSATIPTDSISNPTEPDTPKEPDTPGDKEDPEQNVEPDTPTPPAPPYRMPQIIRSRSTGRGR